MRPLITMRLLILLLLLVGWLGCDVPSPRSASGVSKISVHVPKDANGLTIEQKNVRDRLLEDNTPGAIKHLYVISAYSGQTIMYSTVRGKVTSGGKRLTPITVNSDSGRGFGVDFGNVIYYTDEVLQDDGTYGSSVEYLYWWDTRGIYHQHYVSGGQIVHVASQPIAVKGVIINLEMEESTTAR